MVDAAVNREDFRAANRIERFLRRGWRRAVKAAPLGGGPAQYAR